MLLSLHVKNLALIAEEEILFTEGLNILTGETGAGKSIVLGSIALALGARADKEIIRDGAEYALVEVLFSADSDLQRAMMDQLDLPLEEDDQILIRRRIYENRSIASVNGESVTAKQLKELSQVLLDVYGQRENQTLLKRANQLALVDDYAGAEAASLKADVRRLSRRLDSLSAEWENGALDERARKREIDLISYEIEEISGARVKPGEAAELQAKYRRMASSEKLMRACQETLALTGPDGGALDAMDRAARALAEVSGSDGDLDALLEQLSEIDSLLGEFNRAVSDYEEGLTYDPEEFIEVESRLDLIRRLSDKYAAQDDDGLDKALGERQERLEELENYEHLRDELRKEIDRTGKEYGESAGRLSALRQEAAKKLSGDLKLALEDLNFLQAALEIRITPDPEKISPDGMDSVSILISTNPGEAVRPLENIASGGELSRIMLAVKTVFAGKDEVTTFVFDEIDAGISGLTAWKVAGKLKELGRSHQILCITHLPQIAAMGRSHFRIGKSVHDGRTFSGITRLDSEGSLRELARLLGGDEDSGAALDNARELKARADSPEET